MSIKIQSMVWDRHPGEDHEPLLALKLADICDDNGEHIFPPTLSAARATPVVNWNLLPAWFCDR